MKGFRQIIGHKDVIGHLQNAIATNKVSHAYILNGEKGSGKKTIARVFAKALNCESDEEKPCDTCHSCRQANSGNHPDIMEVTHEKPNSISVDDIREQIVEDVQVRPYSSPYKVYIVSDAEKMTMQAQNALLKTIEEPPSYVVVLLLTTNAASLLPTILSRCVMLNTKPVPDSQVRTYLMEHVKVPDYQADICVAFAQGNIGKAVQLATSENFNEIKGAAIHLLTHLKDMDIGEITAAVKAVSEFKVDVRDYLDILAVWYRDVLYFKATNDANGIIFRENLRAIQEQTRCISYEGIERILEGIQELNRKGSTVIYTSHYIEEVEQICTRIAILDHGRCIASGTAQELKSMIRTGETITVEAVLLNDAQTAAIQALPHVFSVSLEDHTLKVRFTKASHNLVRLLHFLESENISFGRVFSELPTLNDVFLELTGKQLRD